LFLDVTLRVFGLDPGAPRALDLGTLQLSRVQIKDHAAAVTALLCDGIYYDVRRLAARLLPRWKSCPSGFFNHVVAARAARLDELYARLQAGQRPTEARLHDVRILPPCDGKRSIYVQLEQAPSGGPPLFQQCDARALVGHGQPVLMAAGQTGNPEVRVGLAVMLADELWQANAREAERAVLGFSLLMDWRDDRTRRLSGVGQVPSQLGPTLVVGPSIAALRRRSLEVSTPEGVHDSGPLGDTSLELAESLAYLSQHLHLCPGDLVGLPARLRIALRYDELVTASLTETLTLSGWAMSGPEPVNWHHPRRNPA